MSFRSHSKTSAAFVILLAVPSLPFEEALAQVLQPGSVGGPKGDPALGPTEPAAAPSGAAPNQPPTPADQLRFTPQVSGSPTGAPAGPIGGGNVTSSSSMPVTGTEEDSFDLGPKAGAGGAVHGAENGPIFGQGEAGAQQPLFIPNTHTIRRGDTLWALCDEYFKNPYAWPKIWSYNPQIHNPHWIYPGDQVRLRQGGSLTPAAGVPSTTLGAGGGLVTRARVAPNTIFLRDQGYIEDNAGEDWGEVTGAPEEKMFLAHTDIVYVRVDGSHDVKPGQELTVFRPVRSVAKGKVIEIQGTVRVDEWSPKDRIARGELIESLDVIERGARVGPVERKFEMVPPVTNDVDLRAHIITSIHPFAFYGQNQVVFVDKGSADGVRIGNRFFVMRKGDAWRQSLATPGAGLRISPESETLPEMEKAPGGESDSRYPTEVIGELRVVDVRPHTCTCLVSESKKEIEKSDDVVGRKGY